MAHNKRMSIRAGRLLGLRSMVTCVADGQARVLVQAAVTGPGAAIGRPMLLARELESRTLVPLFDRRAEAPERGCLITTAAARQRPEVRAFRAWILDEARAASDAVPRHACPGARRGRRGRLPVSPPAPRAPW